MVDCADLEIALSGAGAGTYAVQLRFRPSESDSEEIFPERPVRFDVAALEHWRLDPLAYGQQLADDLTSAEPEFVPRLHSVEEQDKPLRLRLLIEPSASELHHYQWERLCHPVRECHLLSGGRVFFSRYLVGRGIDGRPVRRRARGSLHALVVIANPTDLSDYDLARLDVEAELGRARKGLSGIATTVLAVGHDDAPTAHNLLTQLNIGVDIVYLVCHGRLPESNPGPGGGQEVDMTDGLPQNEPWLWLEADDGTTERVSGSKLAEWVGTLDRPPRLVVLASCQSAGAGEEGQSGDGGVLAALGPLLAEAGVPAVVAMQGNISTQTIAEFMPTFFDALRQEGQIDRAMALARGMVAERPDAWVPVLFMRLKSGRLWYVPGFSTDRPEFDKWPALLQRVTEEPDYADPGDWCTPILGPGLLDSLFGSPRELAEQWAKCHRFPLAPYCQEDFARVAQYLSINQEDDRFLYRELQKYLRQQLVDRHGDWFSAAQREEPLESLMTAAGKRAREDPAEPHRQLAELNCPLYITTNPDDLLQEALCAVGKVPEVAICPWNDHIKRNRSLYRVEPGYQPTRNRPLIYHLYGRLKDRATLVLTEDDYFKYLIGITENEKLIPSIVRRALTDSALLFLGFQLDDWNYRVLFHSLLSRGGRVRLERRPHIAAQVSPDEDRFLIPERARRYLESYFFEDARISIYWGSVDDFMRELLGHRRGDGDGE